MKFQFGNLTTHYVHIMWWSAIFYLNMKCHSPGLSQRLNAHNTLVINHQGYHVVYIKIKP